MIPGTTRGIVVTALGINLIVVSGKIAAYAGSGSAALLSEAVHSLSAIAHQGLLLFGLAHAQRPADARHPLGYRREIYFWTFAAAVLLYAHGAGVAIFEGVQKLKSEPFLTFSLSTYALPIIGMILLVVFALLLRPPQRGQDISVSDPVRTVLMVETAAGICGLLVALTGLFAKDQLGMRNADAQAALATGFVMAVTAVFLSLQVKAALTGRSADADFRTRMRTIVDAATGPGHAVTDVSDIQTVQHGPDAIDVILTAHLSSAQSARQIEVALARLEQSIQDECDGPCQVMFKIAGAEGVPQPDSAEPVPERADSSAAAPTHATPATGSGSGARPPVRRTRSSKGKRRT